MNYYKKIMAQRPCGENIEQRVRGFIHAMEAGDISGLAEYDFDWVVAKCFTAPAWEAYQEAIAPAREAYQEAIAPAREAYQEATAPAEKAYQEATAPAWEAYQEATAPIFLALAREDRNWK